MGKLQKRQPDNVAGFTPGIYCLPFSYARSKQIERR
jgi:hypothetical protein